MTLPDALQQQLGPSTENYLLPWRSWRVSFRLDSEFAPESRKSSGERTRGGLGCLKRVAKYVEFYLREDQTASHSSGQRGVVTNKYEDSYEAEPDGAAQHSLLAYFPSQLTAQDLHGLALMVVFIQPDEAAIRQLAGFVEDGGVAVLVSLRNLFPGARSGGRQASKNSVIYAMGRGKVIELADGVGDPGAFSKDVRRLLGKENLPISLWNASTIIAIPS